MDRLLTLGASCALVLPVAGAPADPQPAKTPERPNILFIMCDDMGYGDLGCYGQKFISTPNIDSLASRGVRFTQAYAGSPVSAPSRASLMTGQHSGHCEVRGNKEYWPGAPMMKYGDNDEYTLTGQHPYDPEHPVLPEIMKQLGYDTGMFGKWAGGYEGSVSTPDKRGVDNFFGYICQFQAHLYYPNFLNRYCPEKGDSATVRVVMDENIKHPMWGDGYALRTQYSADLIHREALAWLDSRKPGKPFMGIFTYTLPHAELYQPNDSILKAYKEKFFHDKTWGGQPASRYNATANTHAQFAAMITRLDSYVGEITAMLDRKGLSGNTLIIFTSDNGPHEEGGADPTFFGRDGLLRGLKRQTHEGGIRVPFIARWPGHIPEGTTDSTVFAFYDLLPTFASLGGARSLATLSAAVKPQNPAPLFDGLDMSGLFERTKPVPVHDHLYWEFDETDQVAVRKGDWKLICKSGKPSLYNLADDIHEDFDLAGRHPEIVRQLIEIAKAEHTDNPHFTVTVPR